MQVTVSKGEAKEVSAPLACLRSHLGYISLVTL